MIYFTGVYHGKSSPLNHHHLRESTVSLGNWLCRHHTRTRRISASIRPGFANLPARMAEQASAMYAQNMANLLRHVHAKGGLNSIGKGKIEAHLQKGWNQKKCHTFFIKDEDVLHTLTIFFSKEWFSMWKSDQGSLSKLTVHKGGGDTIQLYLDLPSM